MRRTKVNLTDVRWMLKLRRTINSADLQYLDIYDGTRKITVDPKSLEEWRFTGLNNVDFLACCFLADFPHVTLMSFTEKRAKLAAKRA